jgi:hypothetical protein
MSFHSVCVYVCLCVCVSGVPYRVKLCPVHLHNAVAYPSFYWTDFSHTFPLKLSVAYYLRRYMTQSPYYCFCTRSVWIPNDQRLSRRDVRLYIISLHWIRKSLEKNIFCYAAFYIVLVKKHEGKDYFEDSGVGDSITLTF